MWMYVSVSDVIGESLDTLAIELGDNLGWVSVLVIYSIDRIRLVNQLMGSTTSSEKSMASV